jgi:solute carrier family 35 protein C2
VAAAVLFLGEAFTWINALGLLVLILGVVLFNWLKWKKLKAELAADVAVAKLDAAEGGGGGELELSRTSSAEELAPHGGARPGAALSPGLRAGGSGEHQVLMLGTRQGFLLEDEQLLREASPRAHSLARGWRPARARSRSGSPTQAATAADAHDA